MKLIFKIEYFTRWGENIYWRCAGESKPLKYVADGIWSIEMDGLEPGRELEYRYEVREEGLCRRTEWESHIVIVPEKQAEIKDKWNAVPENLALASAPFRDGVFRAEAGKKWRAAGVAVPVFSLRSENDFGIGEFNDLKLLVDWAVLTGQKIIQLLPINDTGKAGTWEDSYPYNANSSFALHQQFIHLPDVGVSEDEEYNRLKDELNALPTLDYERVNKEKDRLLRLAFQRTGDEVVESEDFKDFITKNAYWLLPFAAFRRLKEIFGTADFTRWKDYAVYDEAKVGAFIGEHRHEIDYYCFVQYHLHLQLSAARDYARSKGVVFKGDIPIGVSRASADAWTHRELFHLDSQAGAPPDAFATEGQDWGFPTYNWDEMAKDDYAWWKARLRKMAEYFDVFRIDHILGFFRIWEIPQGYETGLMGHFSPAMPYSAAEVEAMGFHLTEEVGTDVLFLEDPRKKDYWHPRIDAWKTEPYERLDEAQKAVFNDLYEDFFYHRHNDFWKDSALQKLPSLLTATGMLACGEDLGMIPACVPDVMKELQINSLEIQRMSKSPYETFADPAKYPYLSVCTTSTHDMSTLRGWWEEDAGQTQRYWEDVLHRTGPAPATCPADICLEIVRSHLESTSMLAILPIQDWLGTDADIRFPDPAKERINVPAISHYYWRYRLHLTLETLLRSTTLNEQIKSLITASGR